MNNLLVIGAGGHAKSVLDCALSSNTYNKIGILVDYGATEVLGFPVIGKINEASKFLNEYKNAVVAIGDNKFRYECCYNLLNIGFKLPVICHKTAYISKFSNIGYGTVLLANSVVNAASTVGIGCIINTGASVDHDCVIKNGVHISPKSTLCGTVTVNDLTWIGAGSTIIERKTIGKNVIIGAGSTVIKDIPDNCVAYGSPAKIIRER